MKKELREKEIKEIMDKTCISKEEQGLIDSYFEEHMKNAKTQASLRLK